MQDKSIHPEQDIHHKEATHLSFTEFDSKLARQLMDKDNDGICDICGMEINLCIQSGQLQCNMDPDSTIGILGSDHIHTDFKVYINGKPLNFADSAYYEKSSFIHLDESKNEEEASGVLHMHAKNTPLKIFFDSIGFKFNKTCITFNSQDFCNNKEKNLKFYVNNQLNNEFEDYIFKDSDKILISYGLINEDIQPQLGSITNFAEGH